PVLLPYPHEFAETDCAELGGRDISCAPRVLQRLQGLVDALGGHLKRAEMHADALGCLEVRVRLYRFRRIHVHGLHEPARLAGTEGQECKTDRAKPLSDVAEEGSVGRIASEEYARAASHERKPAPQGSVSIERISCGEVLRRRQRGRQCGGLRFLPPIEFLDAPNTAFTHKSPVS